MEIHKTTLERAFDLARSGTCLDMQDLIHRLKAEGYNHTQIEGPSLRKQLLLLIRPHVERPQGEKPRHVGPR